MKTIASRAKKNMQTKLTVVPFKQPCTEEVIEALTYLLAEAVAGRVTSLIYGAQHLEGKATCEVVGKWGSDRFAALGVAYLIQTVGTDSLRLPRD